MRWAILLSVLLAFSADAAKPKKKLGNVNPIGGGGIQSINGDTTAAQTLVSAATGTDFSVSTAAGTTTFSLPPASATASGKITNGTQTIAGAKTFSTAPAYSSLTPSTVPFLSAGRQLTSSSVSPTELGYLSGVTSAIQTQLDSKQAALSFGNLTSGTTGVTVTGGTGAVVGVGTSVSVQTASGSQPGLLSAADWTTFNGKQASGSYITALTGDVTASGPGSSAATIAASAVTNSKLANMAATTIKGNSTGGSAAPSDLSVATVTSMLNAFVGDSGSGGTKGLVPAPAAGDAAAGKYLKADGTWATVSGGGGITGPGTTAVGEAVVWNSTTGAAVDRTTGFFLKTSNSSSDRSAFFSNASSPAVAGGFNTGFGYGAGAFTGTSNVGIGSGASRITTSFSVLVGTDTGGFTGNFNTVVGAEAGAFGTTGGSNAIFGAYSCNQVTTGSFNVCLGNGPSGSFTGTLTTGQKNILIGQGADTDTSSRSNVFVANQITDAYFGSGILSGTPTDYTIHGSGGTGSNIAGGKLTLAGGIGTGTGAGGALVLRTAPAGSTGSTANTLADRFKIDAPGNVILNPSGSALGTTATDGFTYVPTMAGTPTGTPTAYTGAAAMVVDTTNKKLCFYFGGAWECTAALTP